MAGELVLELAGGGMLRVERGALARLPALLRGAVDAHRWAIIADSRVADLHGVAMVEALRANGFDAHLFPFPAGEHYKTRDTWGALTDALLAAGVGRDGAVLALGGGVSTDLGGFVAATYLRGVPLVLVPTSLLAMVDAAIGGKTGVDVPAGKNMVGAFHPPRLVVTDPDTLRTLPDAEYRDGLAEAVKHAAIADAAQFEWIAAHAAALAARSPEHVEALIRRSVEIKVGIVREDPLERGRRATLNFGHTVAHALERLTGYAVSHGRAVAIGLVAEAELGVAVGVTRVGVPATIARLNRSLGLPCALPPGIDAQALLAAAVGDKKSRRGTLRFALLAEVGAAAPAVDGGWTHPVDAALARAVLQKAAAPPRSGGS
jgi:3-dehydroquinate synthase